jgi:GNAT superfamily N-acetyltransferase
MSPAVEEDRPVLDIPLTMLHEHVSVDGIPSFVCPEGFRIRTFVPGDDEAWVRIETAAGAFPDEPAARRHFATEFGSIQERLPGRMLFLEHEAAGPIGTTTAWDGEFAGEPRGRIHWVGIVPAFQGRGLSKPLMSAALMRLARDYRRAYLTTETTSYRGINLYLGFGFVPWVASDRDRQGWAIVAEILGRAIL